MHLLKIHTFLHDLRHPGNVWNRHLLRSRVKTFLDRLPNWRGSSHLRFIGRGAHSMVYSFVLRGGKYVIRIGVSNSAFARDSFAAHYADRFPVPRVFETGEFGRDRYYSISERMAGTQIRMLKMSAALKAVHMMFETFKRIHLADVTTTKNFGNIDSAGNGCFTSWQEFLLSHARYRESEKWSRDMAGTYLDQQLFDRCLEQMKALIPFCPEERSLVHGDCSFCNVLSDGVQITGVIDWEHCSIGDALFDFASCYYWFCHSPLGRVWFERVMQTLRGEEHFDERLRCYMLKSATGALINAVPNGDIEAYGRRTARVNHLLRILDKPVETWNDHT